MVPEHLIKPISDRLTREVGERADVKTFVFRFAACPRGHELDYALDELRTATDPEYKKAIRIVIEEYAHG